MYLTLLKANVVSGQNRNARNRPEIIWVIRQIPDNDPKFHHKEILEGVGNSTSELLIIFKRGFFLNCNVIKFLFERVLGKN